MDEHFMKRAIELAAQGAGRTSPNPLVGAVVVKEGRIIGEGYHRFYGGNHAEVEAILAAGDEVRGSTVYVNLEPCSHFGRTPPCADRLVEEGVARVVIAMVDPNPKVRGKGIEILRKNGIEVMVGVLEKEAMKLNEIFLKYITTGMPFVIMKYAMTLDGRIATRTGDSRWISGEASRLLVHRQRSRVAAVMVGSGTVLADNPRLNVRIPGEENRNPLRIVVDGRGRIPASSRVFDMVEGQKTLVATTENADRNWINDIESTGASVHIVESRNDRVSLLSLLKILGERKIDSILIEGGAELNAGFLEEGLVDKVQIYLAPRIAGGRDAKGPVGGEGISFMNEALMVHDQEIKLIDDDIFIEGYLRKRGE